MWTPVRVGMTRVEVYERNDRARGFYEHMDFVPDGQRLEAETGLTLLRLRRAGPPGTGH